MDDHGGNGLKRRFSFPVSKKCKDQGLGQCQRVCRLAFLGAARVGKTSLVARCLGQPVPSVYEPTADDLYRHEARCYCGRASLLLEVMDAGGECDYPAMREDFITSADVLVLVFSLDDEASLKEAKLIRRDVKSALDRAKVDTSTKLRSPAGKDADGESDWLVIDKNRMVLVGNKSGARSQNGPRLGNHGQQSANDWDCPYVETNALDCVGITELMDNALPRICTSCQVVSQRSQNRSDMQRRRENWALQRPKRHDGVYSPTADDTHDVADTAKPKSVKSTCPASKMKSPLVRRARGKLRKIQG